MKKALVSICLTLLLNGGLQGETPYPVAPQEMHEHFGKTWEAYEEHKDEARTLEIFEEMLEESKANGYLNMVWKLQDAIRIMYVNSGFSDTRVLEQTHIANESYIARQKARGYETYGHPTMVTNLYHLYQDTGRVAMAQAMYRLLLQDYKNRYGMLNEHYPRMNSNLVSTQFLNIHNAQLILEGKPETALREYQHWVNRVNMDCFESGDWWVKGTLVSIQHELIELKSYLWQKEEAQQARAVMLEKYPRVDGYYSPTYWKTRMNYFLRKIRTEGALDTYVAAYEEAVGHYDASQHNTKTFSARLESEIGNTNKALELVSEAIDTFKATYPANDRLPELLTLLKSKAEYSLRLGITEGVQALLEEAMIAARRSGDKPGEPSIYLLQGRYYHIKSDYPNSLSSYREAIRLFHTLGVEVRVIDTKIRMLTLYHDWGRPENVDHLWQDILRSLKATKVPKDVLIDAWQTYAAILAAREKMPDAQKALSVAHQHADDAGYPALKKSLPKSYKPKQSASERQYATVLIDPAQSESSVFAGESVRNRFILSNVGQNTEKGFFTLKGAGTIASSWNTETGILTYTIEPGSETSKADSPQIEARSGEQLLVYLEHNKVPDETVAYQLSWTGKHSLQSTWTISAHQTPHAKTQIANSSEATFNLFYAITFFHEVFVRSSDMPVSNIRALASMPCRVEIWDSNHEELIAVDANGNGSFEDPGDMVNADADANLYPDLDTPETYVAIGLELMVYPLDNTQEKGDLSVEFQLLESDGWQTQVVDTIRR